jgi:hypothetical protein
LIETCFAFPRLNRHYPSFIFDLPLSVSNFHFFGLPNSLPQIFLTCPLVYSPFSIIGLPFLALCVDSNIVSLFLTKNPHLPLMWGVIHVRVLFLKEIFYQAQNEIVRIYLKYCEKSEQK